MKDEQRGVKAIEGAFQEAAQGKRAALITYLTAGYPSLEVSPSLVLALQAGGADLIELGIPFSDPVADGPTIQKASYQALQAGVTPEACLDLVKVLREAGLCVPLLLMGYYNPILAYGIERFVSRCAQVGVDGLIVPDLPPEEAKPLREACQRRGLAMVFLVAPTTRPERMAYIAAQTSGFLYVVSRLGTTGGDHTPDAALEQLLKATKNVAQTPVAVGFGVSRPEVAHHLAHLADGVIVGSAIVERAPRGAESLEAFTRALREALVR